MSSGDTRKPRIYQSLLPPIPPISSSVFTFLFSTTWSALPASTYGNPAYIDASTGRSVSRGEVKDLSLKLAWGLRNRLDLGDGRGNGRLVRGDMVMVVSPNSLSWPVTLFGCIAAGVKVTFAACSATPRELAVQYADSKPRIVVVASHLVSVVREMFSLLGVSGEEVKRRIWVMDLDYDALRSTEGRRSVAGTSATRRLQDLIGSESMRMEDIEQFEGADADETVFVCYSSGTTGKPKGVETTHRNLCTVLRTTQALWGGCETKHDVYISVIPFYHIFGLAMLLHYPFMRGCPLVMLDTSNGFQPERLCAAVERWRVTTVCCVPPIILALAEDPCMDRYDLSSITNITSGAAALSVALATRFLARLEERGARAILIQGCGSTETTCPAQIVAPADSVSKFGSVGQLVPNIEARLVGDAGRDVAEGEDGEMWVRGPTICKGYLNNPEANASSFTRDGWYKTGDVLRRDNDGYFYIVDRKKEMLKWKGHQIAPAELEAILMEHPAIADVGVVGVKDAYSGDELPRAYIVPRTTFPSSSSSSSSSLASQIETRALEREIAEWIKPHVARYKYLRGGVRVVAEIPKSGTGKILRKELREMAERKAREERERGLVREREGGLRARL